MTEELDVQRELGEPDRSLAGQPLFLHINDGDLDEAVEKATSLASQQPIVPIIAVRFAIDPDLRKLVHRWLGQQRKGVAAWKAQEGISGGRLSLRSRVATDNATGTDWVWTYVVWEPAKVNEVQHVHAA